MSFQLEAAHLQQQLDKLVAESSATSRNQWLNRLIRSVVNIKTKLTSDVIAELTSLSGLIELIPWERIDQLHKDIRTDPLCHRVDKADLLLALINEGLQQLETRHHTTELQKSEKIFSVYSHSRYNRKDDTG